MSINETTPEEWNKASKTVYGKLNHPNDTATAAPKGAIQRQVGGDHYKKFKIQPLEYALENGLGICEHAVVKYVTRWSDKNGIEDLRKAIHYLEILIQRETQ
tara:strand:+ start:1687 stop:1992 length:306 start_codon:yes stop_codon:yes gene_type:complete